MKTKYINTARIYTAITKSPHFHHIDLRKLPELPKYFKQICICSIFPILWFEELIR